MPMYLYRYTDDLGGMFETYQPMRESSLVVHEGRPCERAVQPAKVRTLYGKGSGTDPIKMLSIALDDEAEIADFRVRNPGVEISSVRSHPDFGVPVARSRTEKLKILDNEGFIERN